jgi:N-acetylglutamate synthase-like GNAT family acetyltransferase
VDSLPDDLAEELIPASVKEGFSPMQWLREQWDSGTNRFSEPGEALYVARLGGKLVGVCGLNRDPFARDSGTGRLRRLYVLPEMRRRGIGRVLVVRVLEDAQGHFDRVNLRTLDDQSAEFFEALGFARLDGVEGATHKISTARSAHEEPLSDTRPVER